MIDYGKELQMAYDDGYKQGRYDEMVETEMSLPKWIPCSERLPEDNVEVMTTVEIISNGKRFVEQGSYFYHGWYLAYDHLRLASNIRVIAWMPLPEPYKGGDTNDVS